MGMGGGRGGEGWGEGREEERSTLTVSAYLIRSRINRVRAWRVARVLGRGRGGPACTCRSKEVAWRPEAGEWEEERRRVKRYGWWRFYLENGAIRRDKWLLKVPLLIKQSGLRSNSFRRDQLTFQ